MPTIKGVYYGDEIYQSPYNISIHGYRLYFSSSFKMSSFIKHYHKAIDDVKNRIEKIKYIDGYSLNQKKLLLEVYAKIEPTIKAIMEE